MKQLAFGIAALTAFASSPALTAPYDFTFDTTSTFLGGPFQTIRGTFSTSDTAVQIGGQTAFAITGISGTINDVAITGLFAAPGDPTYYYFASGPTFLDGSGVRFNAGAAQNIAFFHQDGVPAEQYRVNGNGTISAFGTASSSPALVTGAVPEPAAWAMMILGAGAVGVVMRRRRKVNVRVSFTG